MQELSAIVPARDKQTIIKTAISKVDILANYCAWQFFFTLSKRYFCDNSLTVTYSVLVVSCCDSAAVWFPSSNIQPWNCLGAFLAPHPITHLTIYFFYKNNDCFVSLYFIHCTLYIPFMYICINFQSLHILADYGSWQWQECLP
jgi:hypothetical protein